MTFTLADLAPVLIALVTIGAGFITWGLNERSKRRFDDYTRRETRYVELIRTLRGFHVGTEEPDSKKKFLAELELCWLYGSDDVVRAGYAFLATVKTGHVSTDEQKELAVGKLALAIRRDLMRRKPLKRTKLKAAEFEILGAS